MLTSSGDAALPCVVSFRRPCIHTGCMTLSCGYVEGHYPLPQAAACGLAHGVPADMGCCTKTNIYTQCQEVMASSDPVQAVQGAQCQAKGAHQEA